MEREFFSGHETVAGSQPDVTRMLELMRVDTLTLRDMVMKLYGKIEPILADKASEDRTNPEISPTCAVSVNIYENVKEIEAITSLVFNMLDRIQL